MTQTLHRPGRLGRTLLATLPTVETAIRREAMLSACDRAGLPAISTWFEDGFNACDRTIGEVDAAKPGRASPLG